MYFFLQPVGFVTFNTRAGAEAAKQDLQVGLSLHKVIISITSCTITLHDTQTHDIALYTVIIDRRVDHTVSYSLTTTNICYT